MNKNKLIIILVGLLDVLSIGIVVPVLPDLIHYYNVSTYYISFGITSYMLCAFFAAPFLGQLSDKFGRKGILILCVLGSFLSSLLIAATRTYKYFIIGRIVNGITGGNISILQTMMSDISKTKDELRGNIGTISTLISAGFIIGPLFGAIFLNFGVMAPFWFMTLLSLLETLMLIFFLDETINEKHNRKLSFNPFKQIIAYLKKPEINMFMVSLFLALLSYFLFQSILPLYFHKYYGLTGTTSGYIMAGFGVIMFMSRAFLFKNFWFKYFSLNKLLYIVNIGIFSFLMILFFVKGLYLQIFILSLLITLTTIINPVYQAEIIDKVEHTSRGEVIGVLFSLQSMVMFLGPLFGGYFLDKNVSIFALSALLSLIGIFIVIRIVKIGKIKNQHS